MSQEKEIFDFAAEEIKHLLKKYNFEVENNREDEEVIINSNNNEKDDWIFSFNINNSLMNNSFSLKETNKKREMRVLQLSGDNGNDVLRAVYTALEKVGIMFEVNGPLFPEKLDFSVLKGINLTIKPKIKRHGIRQHINFPMDISAYTIEEAREYIRNLARMRFNSITFHSYRNQWYEVDLPDKKIQAGNFFYGIVYEIPDHPVLKKAINNDKYYCNPEIELMFNNHEEKSKAAIHWLQELMKEVKRAGMYLQFSIELGEESYEEGLIVCDQVQKLYPMIDRFELITEENGRGEFDEGFNFTKISNYIEGLYGEKLLNKLMEKEEVVEVLKEPPMLLPEALRQLNLNTKVIKELMVRWEGEDYPDLAVGVYYTDHQVLKVLINIMRLHIPENVEMTFLPDHGNRKVVEAVNTMQFTEDDWARTMLYSWIELDGSMFYLQNAIKGIKELIAMALKVTEDGNINGICFNHWRTAENSLVIRYASLVGLRGSIEEEEFYKNYAKRTGINNYDIFKKAMEKLDQSGTMVRDIARGSGFCHPPSWWDKIYRPFNRKNLNKIKEEYEEIHKLLQETITEDDSTYAENYLSLLINRVKCTLYHLQIMIKITELQKYIIDSEPRLLSEKEERKVTKISKQINEIVDKRLELNADIMPDKGSQGMLINYYYTIYGTIARIENKYGEGVLSQAKIKPSFDNPPWY